VLHEQARNINDRLDVLRELRRLAYVGLEYLEQGAVDKFGLLLDDAWRLKKQLASNISSQSIDNMYSAAIQAGALGGKIAGAGGGGFLLLYCPVERQQRVRDALNPLPELPIQLESSGTTIVYSAPDALPLVHGPQLDRDVTSAWAV
jgi:D-glycero-alpha-D-manno-heptose-7-phosphate kinase